jgi:HEAT repeat protein
LGGCGDPAAVSPLCRALQDRDPVVRMKAGEALVRLGEHAVLPLCRAAERGAIEGRRRAVMCLTSIADGRAVPALCRCLRSPDALLRWRAAQALMAVAERDPDPGLRAAIPLLRRLLAFWSLDNAETKHTFALALARIESMTASRRDLPMPGEAPPLDPADLPLPGHEP